MPARPGPGQLHEQEAGRKSVLRPVRRTEMACVPFPSMRRHLAAMAPSPEAALEEQPQAAAARARERELPKLRYAYRTRRHTPRSFQPARFISLEISGENIPPRDRFVSTRPVSVWAIWRNISADLWLAETSAIIWPLFAAG